MRITIPDCVTQENNVVYSFPTLGAVVSGPKDIARLRYSAVAAKRLPLTHASCCYAIYWDAVEYDYLCQTAFWW